MLDIYISPLFLFAVDRDTPHAGAVNDVVGMQELSCELLSHAVKDSGVILKCPSRRASQQRSLSRLMNLLTATKKKLVQLASRRSKFDFRSKQTGPLTRIDSTML